MVSNHGDRKFSKDRVVGPFPNGLTSLLVSGGVILTTYMHWDDPPSSRKKSRVTVYPL